MIKLVSSLGVQPASHCAVGNALAEDVALLIAPLCLAAFPKKGRGAYTLDPPVSLCTVSCRVSELSSFLLDHTSALTNPSPTCTSTLSRWVL